MVNLPHVESLDFSNCTKITDELLLTIARHCLHLKAIRLDECQRLTDLGACL